MEQKFNPLYRFIVNFHFQLEIIFEQCLKLKSQRETIVAIYKFLITLLKPISDKCVFTKTKIKITVKHYKMHFENKVTWLSGSVAKNT